MEMDYDFWNRFYFIVFFARIRVTRCEGLSFKLIVILLIFIEVIIEYSEIRFRVNLPCV